MKEKLLIKTAKKSGFVIWGEEEWGCGRNGKIDWSCTYDQELNNFADRIIQFCLDQCVTGRSAEEISSIIQHSLGYLAKDKKKHGIKNRLKDLESRINNIEKLILTDNSSGNQ